MNKREFTGTGDKVQRDAMLWLLRYTQGLPYAELGRLFGFSKERVRAILHRVGHRLTLAASTPPEAPPGWYVRLMAVCAIPKVPEQGIYPGEFDSDWNREIKIWISEPEYRR